MDAVILVALLLLVCVLDVESIRRINTQQRLEEWRSKRSANEKEVSVDEVFGLQGDEHLNLLTNVIAKNGHVLEKYQETFKGFPIEDEFVVIERNKDGSYIEAKGHLVEGLNDVDINTKPQLTVTEALITAINSEKDDITDVIFDPSKDAVLELQVFDQGNGTKVILVYKLYYVIETAAYLSRPIYIIDANTGEVLAKSQGMNTRKLNRYNIKGVGGNIKGGKHTYDINGTFPELTVNVDANGNCVLENAHVQVINLNFSYPSNHFFGSSSSSSVPLESYKFDCGKLIEDDINGAYSPLTDAFFYGNVVHDMFMDWFGRPPLLNNTIKIRVHYGTEYENAHWDGTYSNFGDGDSTFYPLVTIDVVAHEIGHGVTEENSGLIYRSQSGAVNEAFSDMMGMAAESYIGEADWLVGDEIMKTKEAMRYFHQPELDAKSIGNADDFCYDLDVHYGSGVLNKAFYILATKPNWTVKRAFELFFTANLLHWRQSSTYSHSACGVLEAAKNGLPHEEDDVLDAFKQVGITPCMEALNQPFGISGSHETVLYYKVQKRFGDVIAGIYVSGHVDISITNENNELIYTRSVRYSEDYVNMDINEVTNMSSQLYHIIFKGRGSFHVGALVAYNEEEGIQIVQNHVQKANSTCKLGENFGGIEFYVPQKSQYMLMRIQYNQTVKYTEVCIGNRDYFEDFEYCHWRWGEQLHSLYKENLSESFMCSTKKPLVVCVQERFTEGIVFNITYFPLHTFK